MRYAIALLLATTIALPAAAQQSSPASESRPLAGAFRSIFSPQQAPEKKSMGLLQRNFLDLVEESKEKLQVALVIDGTDSMAADMQSVRDSIGAMITDLRRYKGNQVEFCLVVYRDSGAASGEVTPLLNQFTDDQNALNEAIQKLKPESGAPYFPELADLGVHQAITELPWSEEEFATRWIILVGDAPPYDPDFAEPGTGARRRYDTDLLVAAARRKNIAVNCILCTSDSAQDTAYQASLPKTRRFMSTLASQTGGLMLDLSYPDIRQTLIEANMQPRVEVTEIGKITPEDVSAARQAPPAVAEALNLQPEDRVSIAVLPHSSRKSMNFEPEQESVQVAAEMRLKLRQIPQVEIRSPVDVERQARRLQRQELADAQFVQALAVRLGVDYVVWGNLQRNGPELQLTSAVYSRENGNKLADTTTLARSTLNQPQGTMQTETTLVGNTTGKLLVNAVSNTNNNGPRAMNASFRSFTNDPQAMKALEAPLASDAQLRRELLQGMDTLERALAYPVGDSQAAQLLAESETQLQEVTSKEARNAMANMLLASNYFNQAQAAAKEGRQAAAADLMKRSGQHLQRAYAFRADAKSELLQEEIVADYALLIKAQPAEAIEIYDKLASVDTTRSAALRAHWMLAGIYSGDWNVPQEYVDTSKARNHLIQILAHWPESPEAEFIRKHLRWDEATGSQYQYLPKANGGDLLTAMQQSQAPAS